MAPYSLPLVFLPGMGCDGLLWSRQVLDLSGETHPEMGDLTVDDSLEAMARRVLTYAPPKFAVAGLSLGGYVALEMVRQAPDRITRLALFGTRASLDARPRTMAEQGLLATAPHADPTLNGLISGPVQAMAERVGEAVFARQQAALLARPDLTPAIEAVKVPTLVAVGSRDKICKPSDAKALAERIPGAVYHELKDCGHLSPLERPGQVTAALRRWLRS